MKITTYCNSEYPLVATDDERVTVKLVQRHDNLMTLECHYPRYIHSKLRTHCMLSKTCASSRAIPINQMIEDVLKYNVCPLDVRMNQAGMSGGELADYDTVARYEHMWAEAKANAVDMAFQMQTLGIHKHFINRILEPFQIMHMVLTGTDWDHFLELHTAKTKVDPMMYRLAKCIETIYTTRVFNENFHETLHVPYVSAEELSDMKFVTSDALKVSAARCARVSYYNHNGSKTSIEEDKALFDKLIKDKRMSPMEHQALKSLTPNVHYYKLSGYIPFRYIIEQECYFQD